MSATAQFATYPTGVSAIAGLALGAARLDERGEDRLLVDPELGLFGVFDGVGGHINGAAAAELAATTVAKQVRDGLRSCRSSAQAHARLIASLHAADAAIEQYNGSCHPRTTASGATTATVVLLWPAEQGPAGQGPDGRLLALVAHVGDTRAQLLRGGEFKTITLDHAALNDPDRSAAKARQTRLDSATQLADLTDPFDRAAFTQRHMLSSALTGTGELDVRAYTELLTPGDRLLLDSDGLHDNLTTEELSALAGFGTTPQQAADRLASAAKQRSQQPREEFARAKPDDISVLVVQPLAAAVRPQPTPLAPGGSWLSPGETARLPLQDTSRYLVCAADLQLVVVQLDGAWWAVQGELPPAASAGAPGCWQLRPGQSLVLGREQPGNFRYPPSARVSRRHVSIRVEADGQILTVADLQSTNGTEILAG